jgi:Ca-activated chloride channel family protein
MRQKRCSIPPAQKEAPMKRVILVLVLLISGCTSSLNRTPIGDTTYGGPGGAIRGQVVDRSNTPLPGVTVQLDTPRGARTAVTDSQGRYELVNVVAGTYRLSISLSGFATDSNRVKITDHRALVLRTEMTAAMVSEAITVTAAAPLGEGNVTVVPMNRSVNVVTKSRPASFVIDAMTELRAPAAGYARMAENDYFEARKQPVTTFSIDVDGASYANVRRFLTGNLTPPPDAVRIEEMVNYFTYRYAPPADGRPVAISSEVAGCPWAPEHRLLRVGLQARTVEQWKQAPNNLVFLLDVSGSMQPPDRLPLVKSAMRLLVDQLTAKDNIAIVVYAGAAGLALPPTPASHKDVILAALEKLQAGGSTAGGAGIELAYKVAAENFSAGGNNRVILATDGDFNVGVSSAEDLTKLIEEKRKSGIYLTCIGVGTDNLQDSKIELLADKGNGNYYYLDTIGEAKKVFAEQLTGTLVAVADDVKVQIEFNPVLVASYRQIGYENRALENKDFKDDAKDAGELGSGQSVTALYEIVPAAGASGGQLATIRLRYKDPGAKSSQEVAAAAIDERKSAYEASPDTQFAAAVAEFGMLLRNSKHRGKATYADVAALARAMQGEDMQGYREELIRLVEASRTIMGEQSVASGL